MRIRSARLRAVPRLAAAVLTAAVLSAGALPAAAEEPAAPAAPPAASSADDGFALVPATGDHLKIDRRTGDVSLCRERNGTWSCALVPDDRAALDAEIDRLRGENDRLKARVADLERQAGVAPETPKDPWFSDTDRRELDRFLDFSAEAMRRFFGLVEDLKKDYETDRI